MHFIVIKKIPSIFPFLELRYIRTFQCNYWPRKKQTGKKANILPAPCLQPFFFRGGEFSSDYIANSLRLLLLLMTISHVVFPSFLVQPQKSYILLSSSATFLLHTVILQDWILKEKIFLILPSNIAMDS